MKKIYILLLALILMTPITVYAYPCYRHHYYYSGYYVVGTDFRQTEHQFKDCNNHYMVSDTTTYYYSNGTRRANTYYTVYKIISVNTCVFFSKTYNI